MSDLQSIDEKLDQIMTLLQGDKFGNTGLVERVRKLESQMGTIRDLDIKKYTLVVDGNKEQIEKLIKAEEQRKWMLRGVGVGLALNLAGLGAVLSQILGLF